MRNYDSYLMSVGVHDIKLIINGLKTFIEEYEGIMKIGVPEKVAESKVLLRYINGLCNFDENGNLLGFRMKNWDTRKHQQALQYKKDKQKWDKQRAEYLKSIREAISSPTASTFSTQPKGEMDTSTKGQ